MAHLENRAAPSARLLSDPGRLFPRRSRPYPSNFRNDEAISPCSRIKRLLLPMFRIGIQLQPRPSKPPRPFNSSPSSHSNLTPTLCKLAPTMPRPVVLVQQVWICVCMSSNHRSCDIADKISVDAKQLRARWFTITKPTGRRPVFFVTTDDARTARTPRSVRNE